MRIKFADRIEAAGIGSSFRLRTQNDPPSRGGLTAKACGCRGDACTCTETPFSNGKLLREIPERINKLLLAYGIDAADAYAAGGRTTVAEIDELLSGLNLSPTDRMAAKAALHEAGILV